MSDTPRNSGARLASSAYLDSDGAAADAVALDGWAKGVLMHVQEHGSNRGAALEASELLAVCVLLLLKEARAREHEVPVLDGPFSTASLAAVQAWIVEQRAAIDAACVQAGGVLALAGPILAAGLQRLAAAAVRARIATS